MALDVVLKDVMGYKKITKLSGVRLAGGCICQETEAYHTDEGDIFVKRSDSSRAIIMFRGEYDSIRAIEKTNCIRVPHPIKVVSLDGGALIIFEYLKLKNLSDNLQPEFGESLARMHLYNINKETTDPFNYVKEFGFRMPTCCGMIPQGNQWSKDWIPFFINKIEEQMKLIEEEIEDHEAVSLWNTLKPKIPRFFETVGDIKPALLHGDLWWGNVKEHDGEPVIYDAASFYGHHEYDLGIAGMFGSFPDSFYEAYHKLIPKAPGFDDRHLLYKLFHHLNHWNHFGIGYRYGSISLLKKLITLKD